MHLTGKRRSMHDSAGPCPNLALVSSAARTAGRSRGFRGDAGEILAAYRQQIERSAEEKGITSPKEKAARCQDPRGERASAVAGCTCRGEWKGRLDSARAACVRRGERAARCVLREPAATAHETVAHALRHGFERQSVRPKSGCWPTALKRGYGSVEGGGGQAVVRCGKQNSFGGR